MADDLLWMVMVTATHHLLVLQSDAAMRSVTTSKSDAAMRSVTTSKIPMLVLVAVFLHHCTVEIVHMIYTTGYASQGRYNILKLALVVALTITATMAAQKETDMRGVLETKVEERTAELLQKNRDLQLVNLAMQASDTAIMITGNDGTVVWSNTAMARLACCRAPCEVVGMSPVQVFNHTSDCATANFKEGERGEGGGAGGRGGETWTGARCSPSSKGKDSRRGSCAVRKLLLGYATGVGMTSEELEMRTRDGALVVVQMRTRDGARRDGALVVVQFEMRTGNGALVVVQVEISPIPEHLGRNHHITIARDVTAKRREQEARASAEREALASQVKTATMQALSHDLRTPLQGIMGVTSTLLMDMSPDRDHEHGLLIAVMASSRLLLTLINNLLDVRRLETRSITSFEMAPVPLEQVLLDATDFCRPFAQMNEVLLDAPDFCRPFAQMNQVKLEIVPSPALSANVICNQLRLQQVIINLLSNAIKFNAHHACVEISCRRMTRGAALAEAAAALGAALAEAAVALSSDIMHAAAYAEQPPSPGSERGDSSAQPSAAESDPAAPVVVVSIRDHGRGIPLHEGHRLFGQFAQLNNQSNLPSSSVGQPSGSGLGLNLCLSFVRHMGGHIWATNANAAPPDGSITNGGADAGGGDGTGAIFSFFLEAGVEVDIPAEPSPQIAPWRLGGLDGSAEHPHALNGHSAPANNSSSSIQDGDAAHFAHMHILLVDDSIINLKMDIKTVDIFDSSSSAQDGGAAHFAHMRILLLVDDSIINLKVMRHMLLRLRVGSVTACMSGAAALEEAQKNALGPEERRFSLVITDIQMPDMDGYEFTKRLLALNLSGTPRVVGLTADTGSEARAHCLRVGMSDVIYKPATAAAMLAFLRHTPTAHDKSLPLLPLLLLLPLPLLLPWPFSLGHRLTHDTSWLLLRPPLRLPLCGFVDGARGGGGDAVR
ncbi:hypothetical protein JKP88DRAFT_349439 [Tribonema minus]|uniref:histidine kinase n=1 Tax=Tribonema minus TaxID=303371 RepID=A0A836CBW2_9STRA|nr:hypothetical protein JKP88DRAFT_349439 [Tribonema minus]